MERMREKRREKERGREKERQTHLVIRNTLPH